MRSYLQAVKYWASAKLCGVEQRALPIFGRAAIALALAHISSSFFFLAYSQRSQIGVYYTSTHDVALVRILNAGLKCTAHGSLKIQDAKITQKLLSAQHRTTSHKLQLNATNEIVRLIITVKAKFHYASWLGDGSKLVN